MKIKNFTRDDGTEGKSYSLQAGDVVTSRYNKVGVKSSATLDKETQKPIPIENYFLGVKWEGEDIVIKITKGQKKVLDKVGDLEGKQIKGVEYENEFGKNVGVRVINDSEKTEEKKVEAENQN